ncbi:BMP family ABC transporter substrate-binding protein [Mycoplasmatota bacterium WC44]
MKRLLSLLVAILVVFTLSACGTDTYDVAMITDSGTIDDESFNQGTWEGIVEYCEANDISHKYYKPLEVSDDAYLGAIDLAVEGGAKVVVTPGFLFETAIYEAQNLYPEVKFILIDGVPHNPDYSDFATADNTLSILFSEHESGFLAGYAAVKDGYTKLGFTGGMAVPAVVKFGVGFIAGSYYAAQEEGVILDFSNDTYLYLGDFAPSDNHKNTAASWYVKGTEVIFAAAGGAGSSIMSAAEENNGKSIGVDIDQSKQSETVITSALKQLGNAVMQGLEDWQNDKFVGGKAIFKGASNDGVALPLETSKFNTFSQADYDAIYKKVAEGTVVVPASHEELVAFFAEEGITSANYPTAEIVQP